MTAQTAAPSALMPFEYALRVLTVLLGIGLLAAVFLAGRCSA